MGGFSCCLEGEVGGFSCCEGRRWVGSPECYKSMTAFGPGLALVGAGWAVLHLLCLV